MISLMLKRTLQTTLCSLFLVWMMVGCEEENPLQIPVPENGVEVAIERLDSAWFDISAITFRKQHPIWQESYEEVYTRYVEDVLQLGAGDDSDLFVQVRNFTTDQTMREVQAKVDSVFPDLSELEEELTDAWRYYHFYFPNRTIPYHLSFNGGFHTPAALTPNGVGIGLEMFLGEKCVFYDYLQIPVYLRPRMKPAAIAPTVMKGWLESEFPLANPTPTLLEVIVQQGKALYAMDAIFPYQPDGYKIHYSAEEEGWAEAHEPFVWAHFIDNDLLFSSDQTEIAKFTSEGPFTVDLVKESPSRMGHYIGWQIVRAYMSGQEKIDLETLMNTKAEDILNQSKYKP
jgi:hypothetical protein